MKRLLYHWFCGRGCACAGNSTLFRPPCCSACGQPMKFWYLEEEDR